MRVRFLGMLFYPWCFRLVLLKWLLKQHNIRRSSAECLLSVELFVTTLFKKYRIFFHLKNFQVLICVHKNFKIFKIKNIFNFYLHMQVLHCFICILCCCSQYFTFSYSLDYFVQFYKFVFFCNMIVFQVHLKFLICS